MSGHRFANRIFSNYLQNSEFQLYTADPANSYVSNGKLYIKPVRRLVTIVKSSNVRDCLSILCILCFTHVHGRRTSGHLIFKDLVRPAVVL